MQSQNIAYFILDLLQQVPTVFVQGLGRFDAIFHPAVIDVQESRIHPPFIQPGFVPQVDMAFDILPSYIHYVTGMEISEANEHISFFVREVLERVETDESYSIEKFGTFSRSSSDILHFTPDWDAFNLSFNGLKTIDLYEEKEVDAPPVYIKPTVPEPVVEEVSRPGKIEVPLNPISVIAPVVETPILETIEEPTFIAPNEIDESTTRLAWAILTSALILITILCAYLAWDIISDRQRIHQLTQFHQDTLSGTNEFDIPLVIDSNTSQANAYTDTADIAPVDTIIHSDSVAKTEEKENPVIAVKPHITIKNTHEENPDSTCFIVVGAFTNSENVTKMMDRLQGLGYKAKEIKGGNLTRVAISTSCDKSNLEKVLGEARSSINPEAWIY